MLRKTKNRRKLRRDGYVVFVGDRPSSKNINPKIAFVGTQSYKRLLEWIWRLDLDVNKVIVCNIEDVKIRRSNYMYIRGIKAEINVYDDKVIALGNRPHYKLAHWGFAHYKLPHPSRQNRQLNDKVFEKQCLTTCKEWLDS